MFSRVLLYRRKAEKIFKTGDTGSGNAYFALLLNKLSHFNDCCLRTVEAIALNVTR